MDIQSNPFKQMEPDGFCPPGLKNEIVSEIDLIRNSLIVVDVYVGELVSVFLASVTPFTPEPHE
jgi:hypothetical protein